MKTRYRVCRERWAVESPSAVAPLWRDKTSKVDTLGIDAASASHSVLERCCGWPFCPDTAALQPNAGAKADLLESQGDSRDSHDLQCDFCEGGCGDSRYFKVFQGIIFAFGSGDRDKVEVGYLAGLDTGDISPKKIRALNHGTAWMESTPVPPGETPRLYGRRDARRYSVGVSSGEWKVNVQGRQHDSSSDSSDISDNFFNSYFFLLNTKTGIPAANLLRKAPFVRGQNGFDKLCRYVR